MIIRDIYYSLPQAAYLLVLAIPILFLIWLLFNYRQRVLQSYNPSQVIIARSPSLFWFKAAAWLLAWVLAVLALMGPKGNLQYISDENQTTETASEVPRRKAHEVIFLVDTSASMSVPDSRLGRTRLDQAKEIMEEVVSQLKGETVSLNAFTSELTPLVPSTLDYLFTRLMIRQLKINEGDIQGTNLEKSLLSLMDKLSYPERFYTIILLSDGGDNKVENLQGNERQQAIEQLVNQLNGFKAFHLRLLTIGMGSEQGGNVPHVEINGNPVLSKLQDDVLKALASHYNGTYFMANDWTTLDLAREINQSIDQDSIYENSPLQSRRVHPAHEEEIVYDLYFQIPLGLALLLLILAYILPDGRKLACFLLIFFLPTGLFAQDFIHAQHQQARLLFEAQGYDEAATLYQRMLSSSLPPWQRAIILYNLGTVRLAQHQPLEALKLYHSIPLRDISSPWLLRNLKINQGLAYLIEAQSQQQGEAEQRLYLLHQSLMQWHEAEKIDCRLQQWEDDLLKTCLNPSDFTFLFQALYQQLGQLKQQQRQSLLETEKNIGLFQLIESLQRLEKEASRLKDQPSYHDFLLDQGTQLMSLWEFVQTNRKEAKAKEQVQEAYQAYKQAFSHLSTDPAALTKSIEILQELVQNLDYSKQEQVLAYYRVMMTYERLSLEALQNLQQVQKNLDLPSNASHALEMSIEQLQRGHDALSRFFFFRSYYALQNTLKPEMPSEDPIAILTEAIERAHQAAQLNRLAQLEYIPAPWQEEVQTILKEAENRTLQPAEPFIQSVLDVQTERYRQSRLETSSSRCQKNPWQQALPLFDAGYQQALLAQSHLSRMTHWPNALSHQEETMLNWREALELIKHPPEESPETEQNLDQPSTAPANVSEVFHLLQEMESQDRPAESEPPQELQGW